MPVRVRLAPPLYNEYRVVYYSTANHIHDHRGADMAKILFTVETGPGNDNPLYEMLERLHVEFPAFYAPSVLEADTVAAVVVSNMGEVPDEAWARLNGWGYAGLTLELVA
jgi:hypothetical protein